jgi:[protein-PII] uridylyltransferase
LMLLADTAPEPRDHWSTEAVEDLESLLGAGRAAVPVIEALDRTGLWARLLPEWGAVRDLPPRDAVHTWTVDRHLMETVAIAADLTTRVSRPDLLLLGALLHDLGKGRGGDHSVVGAALAEQVAARLRLPASDTALLAAMVRHHLLLPTVATRRDLSDSDTVEQVAAALDHDPVLLELLAALAEADSRATGPGVWGDWKARLVGELVRRTRLVMDGEQLPHPDPVPDEVALLARGGGTHVRITPAPGLGPNRYTVVVVSPDGRGLLARMAAVLAVTGLRVHAAQVTGVGAGADASAVNTFTVSPIFGEPPEPAILRQRLLAALAGANVLAELDGRGTGTGSKAVGGRETAPPLRTAAPPRVRWFSGGGPGEVIVELRAHDRLGLLAHAAACIEQAGGDVRWAKVSTMGATVVDAFCIRPPDSTDDGAAFRSGLERALVDAG